MKLIEIKELSPGEITDELKKSRSELLDLRMKLTSRQLESPTLIRQKRKEVARLLTIQTQKLLSGEKEVVSEKKVKKGKAAHVEEVKNATAETQRNNKKRRKELSDSAVSVPQRLQKKKTKKENS